MYKRVFFNNLNDIVDWCSLDVDSKNITWLVMVWGMEDQAMLVKSYLSYSLSVNTPVGKIADNFSLSSYEHYSNQN